LNNYIKYSIAFNNNTNKLVEIHNLTSTNNKNLICKGCEGELIAVIKHKTPHFRHKVECNASSETYIHWVCKEIFRTLSKIELPEFLIQDLSSEYRHEFQAKKNAIIEEKVPVALRTEFKKVLKKELMKSKDYLITKIDLEKKSQSKFGDVKIDIVAYSKDDRIFIEPFLSNPIDIEKEKKLKEIDISTLSIDLNLFIDHYGWDFKLEKLRKYLISKRYKKWSYLNKNTFKEYLLNYEKHILLMVDYYKDEINDHKQKIKDIEKLEKEYTILTHEISKLNTKERKLTSKIKILMEEIEHPKLYL
jgi:hypothetical protein